MRGIFLSAAVMAALAMSAASASAKDQGPVQLLGTQTQVTTSTAQAHGDVAVTPVRYGYYGGYGRGYYGGYRPYYNYYRPYYGNYYRPYYGGYYNNYYRPYGSYYRGYGSYYRY